jgi:hypothetical protein
LLQTIGFMPLALSNLANARDTGGLSSTIRISRALLADVSWVDSAAGIIAFAPFFENVREKLMNLRWAGKGPNARRKSEAYQRNDTLRTDNEAGGPFPAHPFGATRFSAPYFVAHPQRIFFLIRFGFASRLWPKIVLSQVH